MLVKICNGHFSGQSAEYLGPWDADNANLNIDGKPAVLPIGWLELPPRCHSFKSPTKSMRFPTHLEGQLRAYAAHLEQQFPVGVTVQESGAKKSGESVSRVRKKRSVTKRKRRSKLVTPD
jgi:hypothetical protein